MTLVSSLARPLHGAAKQTKQSIALKAMTPREGSESFDTMLREMEDIPIDLRQFTTVAVVGHEGRLSNLLTELTGKRTRPLGHGEAAILRADDVSELMLGRGVLHVRLPVVDHQEQLLREKVRSKGTVSTLLAGFVFSALIAVLLLDKNNWEWHRVTAVTALTVSLILLVSSVYIFDQLSTPEGFWTDARRPWLWRSLYRWREHQRQNRWERINANRGSEAADEASASAVLDGLIGFMALLVRTARAAVIILGSVGLTASVVYAGLRGPDLGAD